MKVITKISTAAILAVSAAIAGMPSEATAARATINTGQEIGMGTRPLSTDIRARLGNNANMPNTGGDVIIYNDAGAFAAQGADRANFNLGRQNSNEAYGGESRADARANNRQAQADNNVRAYRTGINLNSGLNVFSSDEDRNRNRAEEDQDSNARPQASRSRARSSTYSAEPNSTSSSGARVR